MKHTISRIFPLTVPGSAVASPTKSPPPRSTGREIPARNGFSDFSGAKCFAPTVEATPGAPNLPIIKEITGKFVVDNVALALDVAEKLAGFAQTVPFIAPVAGFLSLIVKAYTVRSRIF
jgi:hypothetical protein